MFLGFYYASITQPHPNVQKNGLHFHAKMKPINKKIQVLNISLHPAG